MYKPDLLERKNCYSLLSSSPEEHKCSKGHDAGPARSCSSLPSAARMLAAVDKQGDLCYSWKLLHFDSRTQPVYIYPAGKEGFAGQRNHQTTNNMQQLTADQQETTNHALPGGVPISSPCIHV